MSKRKINYPRRQDLNELPPGAQAFKNVGYQVGKFPVSLFERDTDKRKKHQNAINRYSVIVKLAAHADPDGTNLWVGVSTLAESLGWDKATVHRHLKALRDDGWIIGGGRRGENGSRMRRLVIPAVAVQKPEPEVADRQTEAKKQKSQIEPSEVADSGSEVADRKAEVAPRMRVDLPSEPPQETSPTSPKKSGLVGRLQKLGQEFGVDLTAPGNAKRQLIELAEREGEDTVEGKCRAWLRTASFVGLNQPPVFKFLREYDDGIDVTTESDQARGERILAETKAAETYIQQFDDHLIGTEEGSDSWLERAQAWVTDHPPAGAIANTLLHVRVQYAKQNWQVTQRILAEREEAVHAHEI